MSRTAEDDFMTAAAMAPAPPPMRCVKEALPPRLSGHDVYDAMLKCPGVMAMGIGDCHAVAQILNRKLGLI